MNKKIVITAATFILPCMVVIFLPFGLNITQGILLASVLLAVSWWAANVVNRNHTSFFLIAVFLVLMEQPESKMLPRAQ